MNWGIKLFMAIGGVVIAGNYIYWMFIAKVKGPSEGKPTPTLLGGSETVWGNGEDED